MTPRTTEERWQKTHEQIMNAAENLFAEKGYNGTSMNDIVKKSGFSKGAIYNHFESKERLFLSLLEKQTVIGMDQLRQMFSPDDAAVEKMKKVLDMTMVSTCDCPPEVGRMQLEFMVTASRMDSITQDMQKRHNTIHSFIVELIEEGKQSGEFKQELDSDSLTSLLYAALDGLGLHYATLGIEFDSERLKNTLLKVVLEGILA
jgi:AcrR family transcriptional regulator